MNAVERPISSLRALSSNADSSASLRRVMLLMLVVAVVSASPGLYRPHAGSPESQIPRGSDERLADTRLRHGSGKVSEQRIDPDDAQAASDSSPDRTLDFAADANSDVLDRHARSLRLFLSRNLVSQPLASDCISLSRLDLPPPTA